MATRRLARVLRLRTQLHAHARDELARRHAALVTVEARVETVRASEDRARADAGATAASGESIDVVAALAWADVQATLGAALSLERAVATEAVARAREDVRRTRREEEQLAHLLERAETRARAGERRTDAVLADELALRRHGRTR